MQYLSMSAISLVDGDKQKNLQKCTDGNSGQMFYYLPDPVLVISFYQKEPWILVYFCSMQGSKLIFYRLAIFGTM